MEVALHRIKGQHFNLLPQKCIFWREENTLLIADTHFAKDAVFRGFGIPIPPGSDSKNFRTIDDALAHTRAKHIVVLGDFIHGKLPKAHKFYENFNHWRSSHPELKVSIIIGNHDRHLETNKIPNVVFTHELLMPPFVLTHEPGEDSRGYVLAGHIHPVIHVGDRSDRMRCPVFWFTKHYGVLPSFGEFTGGYAVNCDRDEHEVYLAGTHAVVKYC